jgi:cytochrome c
MQGLEFNKIAAAILTAGIVAMLAGFIARELVRPEALKQNAYQVAGSEAPAAASSGEQQAGPEPIAPLMASADPKAGAEIAKKCTQCHTFEKGGPNRVGPNLFGVAGEPIGQGKGYSFSSALSGKGGTWSDDTLNLWLWKPQSFARGTKMTFAGLPKAKDRADIVAYLDSLK